MTEWMIGLFFGLVTGVCAAPVWVMLSLPMRITDAVRGGNMKMCAVALTFGAALPGVMSYCSLSLGLWTAWFGLLMGGVFVGMLASALTEVLEVIPVMYDRMNIASDLKYAAIALMLGKSIGALAASFIG